MTKNAEKLPSDIEDLPNLYMDENVYVICWTLKGLYI
jgi:hypothetical protein